jgi:hypothetical protein
MTTDMIAASAHFVPLAAILADYGGEIGAYIRGTGSRDNVVTMPVEMEVAGKGGRMFFVAVAVTWNFDSAEPLQDAAAEECPKGHECLFAWVPAHLFGKEDFGIYINDIGVGDNLQNGLVAEIIGKAKIEEAVSDGNS